MSTVAGEAPAFTSVEFRSVCGLFPSGVTVVTRQMRDGRPYGMTVSSFTSVSLNPPLVLVCIDRRCGFIADLAPGVELGISLLREDQQELAVRFSTSPELGRFSGVDWHVAESGAPLLDGAVGAFLCRVDEVLEGGDHVIVLAAVHQVIKGTGRPLVWAESDYHCLPARSR